MVYQPSTLMTMQIGGGFMTKERTWSAESIDNRRGSRLAIRGLKLITTRRAGSGQAID
jgi:hypothetical protein